MSTRRKTTRATLACAAALLVPAAAGLGQDRPPAERPPFERADGSRQLIAAPRADAEQGVRIVPDAGHLAGVSIDPDLDACLEQLGHPVYAVREQATRRMLAGEFSLRQLYALLETRPLSAEQRHRLLAVVQHRLLNTPRGAVGIKVDQRGFKDNQIIVLELLPDLPAREILLVGDRITHLDGVELSGWQEFVDAVQSERPGTKIKVTVERPVTEDKAAGDDQQQGPKFETLNFEIELGSADLLTDPQTGRPQRGGPVWERRQREAQEALRVWGPQPKPVEVQGG